jgi:glycosyltransferase involved in cell wall biosynthesis
MENKRLLTVIIPFLNEREEVGNTIDSILRFSNSDVDIIVINDDSDDNYDYDKLTGIYPIVYIRNSTRLGVAASRDLGVYHCKTPYFLFLDAHMRFYDCGWVGKITSLLVENDRRLLCMQSKALIKRNGEVVEKERESANVMHGATVILKYATCFELKWVSRETKDAIQPIACVLGAGYACSKAYWKYLNGLKGLLYYGNDEAYMSIKVWLEGGECLLLKDVIIGHIYRERAPYRTDEYTRIYNHLLINETIVHNENIRKKLHAEIKAHPLFSHAYRLVHAKRKEIAELKAFYIRIFKHDFTFFETINDQYTPPNCKPINKELLLHEIANHLLIRCYSMIDPGLLQGKMGVIIFLFHYAQHAKSAEFHNLSKLLLEDTCGSINAEMSVTFESGLSGIGWSVQYLFLQNFISGDINEILEDFDGKIMEADICNMQNINLRHGLGGIVLYVNARLYVVTKLGLPNPFKESFLQLLYRISATILDDDSKVCDAIDILADYVLYYEGEKPLKTPSIYDITYLDIPDNYDLCDYHWGLNGSANVGLKLIQEKLLMPFSQVYFQ